jgi:predicted permease
MTTRDRIRLRLRALFKRNVVEREMNDEIQFHLTRAAERLIERGLSERDARAEAEREFGDVTRVREQARDARGGWWIDDVMRGLDLRFAVRSLLARPGFAMTVMFMLALGIGANTAVYSVISAVVLHPIAVDRPDRVFAIFETSRTSRYEQSSYDSYRHFKAATQGTALLGAEFETTLFVGDPRGGEDVTVSLVTDNYFSVVGVRPALGRLLVSSSESISSGDPVAVLSASIWRTRFGGDSNVVGRILKIGGQSMTVIGVAPDGFRGTDLRESPSVWIPLATLPTFHLELFSNALTTSSSMRVLRVIGRLNDDRRLGAVSSINDLAGIGKAGRSESAIVMPVNEAAAAVRNRDDLIRFLGLLAGVVVLTLLMASLNIANLFIVRADERASEFGIRMALGASSTRIALGLVSEAIVLFALGGSIGVGIAELAMRSVVAFTLPGGVAMGNVALRLDWRVLCLTLTVSLVTAMIFALIPVGRAARSTVLDVLRSRSGMRSVMGGRRVVLAFQVAISLMLLVGASLFVRSLNVGLNTELGFNPKPLAAVRLQPSFVGTDDERVARYTQIVNALAQERGVISVAATTHIPLGGFRPLPFSPGDAGASPGSADQSTMMGLASVTDAFFDVIGVSLLSGRRFGEQDRAGAPRVAIVNETAAKALCPGRDPVGCQFNFVNDRTYTVVGIVRDTKYSALNDSNVPFAYAPIAQEETKGSVDFIVRSNMPSAMFSMMARVIAETAPELKSNRPRLVIDGINAVLMPQRIGAVLLSSFGAITLCITAIGIYGTISYAVTRRTDEIGVRRALGAQRHAVILLVAVESAASVAVGIATGVVAAAVTIRLVRHLLYGVTTGDGISYTTAIAVLLGVSVLAAIIPAARATRIDPARAMRSR